MAFILVDSTNFHLNELMLHDQPPNNSRGRQVSILRIFPWKCIPYHSFSENILIFARA
jgi:hypothetical protein